MQSLTIKYLIKLPIFKDRYSVYLRPVDGTLYHPHRNDKLVLVMALKLKLAILADAAKYDASCASSGSHRKRQTSGIGNTEVKNQSVQNCSYSC